MCKMLVNARMHLPACSLCKTNISKNSVADITAKTLWMPTIVHGLNDTTSDELPCTHNTKTNNVQWIKNIQPRPGGPKPLRDMTPKEFSATSSLDHPSFCKVQIYSL